MNAAATLRSTSELQRPRALKSAYRAIFSNRRRSSGRSAAYRFGAYRENACTYEKAHQDRQSLQTDPIGYEDDLNLYAYGRNDPLSQTDPTGEQTASVQIEIESIEGAYGAGKSGGFYVSFYDHPDDGPTLEFGAAETTRAGLGHDTSTALSGTFTGGGPDDYFGNSTTVEIDLPAPPGAPGPTVELGQTSSGEPVVGLEASYGTTGGSVGANETTPVGEPVRINGRTIRGLGERFRNSMPGAPVNWPGNNDESRR